MTIKNNKTTTITKDFCDCIQRVSVIIVIQLALQQLLSLTFDVKLFHKQT